MSDDPKTSMIHESLAAIMRDVQHIGKDRKNAQQNFKFRGIEDVMNSLHEVFKKHEVVIFTEILTHEVTEFKKANGSGNGYHHLSRVAFHLTAKDGSRDTITSLGEAMDYGDKGATKTLSIALKYALLIMFLIPTAETAAQDPDATTHDVAPPESTAPKTPAPKAKPALSTQAEKAEAYAVANADLKWFEITNPLSALKQWPKSPLSDIVADGDVESISKIKEFFGKSVSDKTPALVGLIKKLDMALTEAKANHVPTATDPATGKTVDKPF